MKKLFLTIIGASFICACNNNSAIASDFATIDSMIRNGTCNQIKINDNDGWVYQCPLEQNLLTISQGNKTETFAKIDMMDVIQMSKDSDYIYVNVIENCYRILEPNTTISTTEMYAVEVCQPESAILVKE